MKRGKEAREALPPGEGEQTDAGIRALMDPAALEARLRVARAQRAQVLAARGKTDSQPPRPRMGHRPPKPSDVPAESRSPLYPVSVRPRSEHDAGRAAQVQDAPAGGRWSDETGDWAAHALADIFQPLDAAARDAGGVAVGPGPESLKFASGTEPSRRGARSRRQPRDDNHRGVAEASPRSRGRWPMVAATLLAGVALGVGGTYLVLPLLDAPPTETAADIAAPGGDAETATAANPSESAAAAPGGVTATTEAVNGNRSGGDIGYRPSPASVAGAARLEPAAPAGPRTGGRMTGDADATAPARLTGPAAATPPSPEPMDVAVSPPPVAPSGVAALAAPRPQVPAPPQVVSEMPVPTDPAALPSLPSLSAALATLPEVPAAPRGDLRPDRTVPSPPVARIRNGPGAAPAVTALEASGPVPALPALEPVRSAPPRVALDPAAAANPSTPTPAPTPSPAAAATDVLAVILYPPNAEDAAEVAAGALSVSGVGEVAQRPVDMTISQSNVRYYYAGDRDVAQDVTAIVSSALGEEAVTRDFTGFSPRPSDSLVEIWIAGEAPDRQTAAPAATPRPTPQRSTPSRNDALAAERERLVRSIEERLRQRLR